MIDFPDHFLFFFFFCTLKYENMIRISNISFFRFCWKNEKLDWPKCARTVEARSVKKKFHPPVWNFTVKP